MTPLGTEIRTYCVIMTLLVTKTGRYGVIMTPLGTEIRTYCVIMTPLVRQLLKQEDMLSF